MNDDENKEIRKLIVDSFSTDKFEEAVRGIIKREAIERYLKRSEEWAGRLPWIGAALFLGLLIGAVLSHH
jgi:hypothetical protein